MLSQEEDSKEERRGLVPILKKQVKELAKALKHAYNKSLDQQQSNPFRLYRKVHRKLKRMTRNRADIKAIVLNQT